MNWYVYIILTVRNTLYTGIAIDPEKRLADHLAGKGAKYLRAIKPLRILWRELHLDKSAALKREAAIKKLSRKEKEQLINQ